MRTATPPTIDGDLSDPVWSTAQPIGELIQVEPNEGGTPCEATEVRFLFDSEHLYVGLRFYDREPDEIISTSKERDAFLDADDQFGLLLDTFRDRRNAFYFQMNAAGSKGDALVTRNGRGFNKPWDGIWDGKARVDAEGWTAEMAIPFKTLSFDPALDTWGLNLSRDIGRRNERNRWSGARQDVRFFAIYDGGDLTGLEGLTQGVGLDVVPFFVSDWTNDREGGRGKHLLGDPGLDAFYKVTPNLTLSLTYNTDFAETEVDERQINLTRFPLFFPERRDFFLQDAGLFSFASFDQDSRGRPSLLPFFSRRIGIDADGGEVPLLAGAKLSGKIGDYDVGLLDVQTDDTDGLDGENMFAGRVSKNVGEQSSIGAIVTRGDPESTDENVVYGVDANFRTSRVGDDKNLEGHLWFLESRIERVDGEDQAFGGSVRYPNDLWSWGLGFMEVQENFDPGLGFLARDSIRRYDADVTYSPRVDGAVRQLEFGLQADVITDTDDVLETWELEAQPFGVEWESGDQLQFEVRTTHDELREDFDITDTVTIPVGDYDFTTSQVELQTADKRPLRLGLTLSTGEFFDGDRDGYSAELSYRTGPLFTGSVGWTQNEIDLPGGEFTTKIARVRSRFSFTPNVSWSTFVQWDNGSDTFGVNSQLRWITKPGSEIFLVLNETLENPGNSLSPLFQGFSFKISYTFRF